MQLASCLPHAALVEVIDSLHDFFAAIHDKRAMLHDRFMQWFTADHDKTCAFFSCDKVESAAVGASCNQGMKPDILAVKLPVSLE